MILKSKADIAPCISQFHPHSGGRVLPDGNLLIPWPGRVDDGEIVDGVVEVTSEYPDYNVWLKAINNKEEHFREQHKKQAQTREARRQHVKEIEGR